MTAQSEANARKLAAMRALIIGDLDVSQIAEQYQVSLESIEAWRAELLLHFERDFVPDNDNGIDGDGSTLRLIIDALEDGVAFFDLKAQSLRYVNAALLVMSDNALDDVLGRSNIELEARALRFCPDFYQIRGQFLAEGLAQRVWSMTTICYGRNRQPFDAQVTVIVLTDDADIPEAIVIVVRDISERKRLDAQRDRFISVASHELRTPVTNLKLRMYMMLERPDTIPKHLPFMEQAIERLHRLVETMLELTRFEYGLIVLHRTTVILQQLIAYVIEENRLRADDKQITLVNDSSSVAIAAWIDEDRIIQAINNLVTNAITYTPAGGTVTLRAEQEDRNGTPTGIIEIIDTGISIPQAALPHLFEPFFRAGNSKEKGTGLGLTIAHEIISIHGGTIDVASEPGRGSQFTIAIPLNAALDPVGPT